VDGLSGVLNIVKFSIRTGFSRLVKNGVATDRSKEIRMRIGTRSSNLQEKRQRKAKNWRKQNRRHSTKAMDRDT